MKDENILRSKWNASYERRENFIFYPKEETVKFLNRFVRKRIGADEFVDILGGGVLKGLDFGCGIGRAVILMKEFGIDAYGVDISAVALDRARELAVRFNLYDMENKFLVIEDSKIPFADKFFDITISEGVLDSMPLELAKVKMGEICRVTRRLIFISLISGKEDCLGNSFEGEEIVKTLHEEGTIQSYYSDAKIGQLIQGTKFKILKSYLVTESSEAPKYKNGRYYVVLGAS